MSATGAFATIILERLLDTLTVLVLLASFVFVFGKNLATVNPTGFAIVKWAGASAAAVSTSVLIVLFVLAGQPERLGRTMRRLERAMPSAFAGLVAKIAEKFVRGLGAIRRPSRVLIALAWSFPLWLCICLGIWSVAVAFRFDVPFTGSFLLLSLLVLGVAVPTPGAIGGFHEAFRRRHDDVLRRSGRCRGGGGDRAAPVLDRPRASARPVLCRPGRPQPRAA